MLDRKILKKYKLYKVFLKKIYMIYRIKDYPSNSKFSIPYPTTDCKGLRKLVFTVGHGSIAWVTTSYYSHCSKKTLRKKKESKIDFFPLKPSYNHTNQLAI